ncbi:MAG: hypothetical protein QNK03_21500 [Myxococcota bacterium]|nr:hypothetical protein [Myxococcota bacterium]
MLRAGVSHDRLRVFPTALSALAFGLLLWALLARATRPWHWAWSVGACAVLLVQPGIANWHGALHEHSYAMSLTLVASALGIVLPARWSALWFALGFVSGWVGYDFLPAHAAAVGTARWLYYASLAGASPAEAAWRAALDALRFCSGAAAAILAHILQLALYFGSTEAAVRDLLGSAAARMGMDASAINPEYEQFLRAASRGDDEVPPRAVLIRLLLKFFWRDWSRPLVLAGFAAVGVAATVAALAAEQRRHALTGPALRRRALVAGAAVLGAACAPLLWVVLMPRHAMFHYHMLPRNFFTSVVVFAPIPVLVTAVGWARTRARTGLEPRRAAVAAALYALPLGQLAALGVYALALG